MLQFLILHVLIKSMKKNRRKCYLIIIFLLFSLSKPIIITGFYIAQFHLDHCAGRLLLRCHQEIATIMSLHLGRQLAKRTTYRHLDCNMNSP